MFSTSHLVITVAHLASVATCIKITKPFMLTISTDVGNIRSLYCNVTL